MSQRTPAGPAAVAADLGRHRIYLLGLLGALKALGLVLVADGLATGLSALAGHTGDWREAIAVGVLGALLRAAASWALQAASARTATGVKERLRSLVLRRALRGDGGVGATTAIATTALDELDQYYTVFLPTLVSAATVPLLVGVRILAADWVSALIIVLTVPLIPVFMVLIGVRTRESVAEATTALTRLSDHLVELARGLPVLVGLGRVHDQAGALRDVSEDHRRTSMATLRVAFLSALALELISTISVALVAVFVGVRLVAGDMTLNAGLIALILAPECFAPFRDIGAAFHASQNGVEARRRVQGLLDAPEPAPALLRRGWDAGLSAVDLTVTHAGRALPAVEGLSFAVPAGAVASLEGRSGAGKTTVLEVLAGRGALLEAGAAVSGELTAPTGVAWLPQHPHPVAVTAREELERYGATPEEAMAVLARLGMERLAEADPARLSPGELRRLAVGRVLTRVERGATLVLLDEPTAHLDAASAALVRAEIAGLRGRATVVIASHDPELRALAQVRVPLGATGALTDDERAALASTATTAVAADREEAAAATAPELHGARTALRELAAFLRPVRGRVAAAAAVGSAASLFAVALTSVSGWLIVRASEHPHILYLMVAIVGVRFFGIGRAALRYSERLLTHSAVFSGLTELRSRLWRGLAAQGPAGRSALTPANALDRLVGDADAVRDLAPRVVIPPLSGLITAAAAVVALWLLYRPAGVVALALALVAAVIAPLVAIAADRSASRHRDTERSLLLRRVAALLAARDDLDGNGVADPALDEVGRLDAEAAENGRRAAWALGAGSALVIAACCAAAVAMLAVCAPVTVGGPLPVPLAAVFALTPLALVDPLLEVVAAAQKWNTLAQVLGRVAPVTAAGESARDALGAPVGAVRRLALDDVSYRYPGAPADALRDVTASADRESWLVVTGPSGSGKSTLLGVLLRYLAPTAGHYKVDGRDAAGVDAEDLRRRVSWCPQEGHLFHSTLRGNLAIARPRDDPASEEELTAALTRVGLGPLLDELPLGLDTPIGSEGDFLSGGQRQRVAVARTLLAGGDAVLLDEPTAHLDEESARALMADLRQALAGRTTVLVTHHAVGVRPGDDRLVLASQASEPAVVPRS